MTISPGDFRALISGGLDRLPMRQPLCDQLGAFPIVASVQDAHVLGIGAQVNTGRPRVDVRVQCPNALSSTRTRDRPTRSGSLPSRPTAARSGPAAVRPSNSRRRPEAPSSPSPLRSSIAQTGCHPPAMSGRPPPARRRGPARSARGSRPKAPARCAPSGKTATTGLRCGRRGPRSRSPSEASG